MGLRYWYSQGRKNTGNTQWDGRLLSRYSGLELQARPPRPWCGFCPEAETSTAVLLHDTQTLYMTLYPDI